ncbi:MAG: SRPBCC family protein [bacterium]
MASTHIIRHINAPRADVYHALIDGNAITQWMVPDGMTSHVHAFDAHEGGVFRISLTYDSPSAAGKSSAHTDTYHGRFVTLVPNEKVVEVTEFETTDPDMRGEMTITFTLTDADGGTDINAVHDALPPGLSPADNEKGWQMSLDKLADLLQANRSFASR